MHRRQLKAVVMLGLLINLAGTGAMFLGEWKVMAGLWALSAASFMIAGFDYHRAMHRAKQVTAMPTVGLVHKA